ncbi:uncharacterized protein BO97DRAFT_216349 [Aspergillus homomorphus CBS 101889]|uniref:Uncharacterized protein n=1 Tax=Aspergillus homomorphus (strain CBS 101889) TaxID=1450537 RepID=A0A395I933_ASPHC|nr:hypothetical protein BO97DRAFT_216349 [Aspergillus homomorphus CBS 101889]RAL15568.1 hypothetical protein BO97DRAFT_216349 [Aspergillus homomorphus CBS 101889]
MEEQVKGGRGGGHRGREKLWRCGHFPLANWQCRPGLHDGRAVTGIGRGPGSKTRSPRHEVMMGFPGSRIHGSEIHPPFLTDCLPFLPTFTYHPSVTTTDEQLLYRSTELGTARAFSIQAAIRKINLHVLLLQMTGRLARPTKSEAGCMSHLQRSMGRRAHGTGQWRLLRGSIPPQPGHSSVPIIPGHTFRGDTRNCCQIGVPCGRFEGFLFQKATGAKHT